jgi:hypothetical protein
MVSITEEECGGRLPGCKVAWLILKLHSVPQKRLQSSVPGFADPEGTEEL